MNLKERASKLKSDIPAVLIAMRRKETPILPRIFAILAIVYVLSPVDLIPDFIPIIGYLDDLIIVPFLVLVAIKTIPKHLLEQYRVEAENNLLNNQKKWYYAIPFVLILIIIISFIVSLFI